jgi:hypothetical protein
MLNDNPMAAWHLPYVPGDARALHRELAPGGIAGHLFRPMPESFLAPVRSIFRAAALAVVPESAALDAAQWLDLERIVEEALAQRPAKVRRQLALLLRAIETLPVLATGRRFSTLDVGRRTRFLQSLQDSPVLLLRRGVWGLRTLIFMGYYARPAAAALIGYRADARGWDARR